MINYISATIIPIIIFIIVFQGLMENKEVFNLFIEGVKEGFEICVKIFPTILGLFVAVGMIRMSGIIELFSKAISPIIGFIQIPEEILPLGIIRTISGSAALSMATDIMKVNGVDSYIGNTASVLMAATETTIYTIAIYTSTLKVKKTNKILLISIFGDFIALMLAVNICKIL